MTYILSLAVNYHPNEVAFVLIDYKGGGMAKAFETLPHVAGIMTNLDGSAIKRCLISIESELKRREAIFAKVSKQVGVSNLDIYKYQKLYREGTVTEPLQHLFIISDEFAELKSQQPEFMGQLISTARIGRSLGVHLILATQKPSGVVSDEIWSNSKFRVCLKVQDKSDSQDMLKRPEAAELRQTGRFYLQVGYNELFEMGQSAWAGAPYYPSEKVEVQKDDSIQVLDTIGRVMKEARLDKRKMLLAKPKKQLDVITNYLKKTAEEEHIVIRPLWLAPIPAQIYLDEIEEKYQEDHKEKEGICPVIGVYDDLKNQRQCILRLPISKEGNTAIFGITGSGKNMLMTTIIYSLLKQYTAKEISLYLLDFASETLKVFEKAPQVGDVVLPDENEKVENLLKLMLGQLETRKKLFAEYGGDIERYNANAKQTVPNIVVVIHNFEAFLENYENKEEQIRYLTREGSKYGIYFILTASSTLGIRSRILQNCKQQIALQMKQEGDYSQIVGKTGGLIPSKQVGRGLIKLDQVYEFQTAMITAEKEQYTYLREFCATLQKGTTERAKGIPVLPEVVDRTKLTEYITPSLEKLPIGIETNSLEVYQYPFGKNYMNMVLATDDSYIKFETELIKLYAQETEAELTVLDINKNTNFHNAYCNIEQCSGIIDMLFDETARRHNQKKEAQETGEAVENFKKKVIIIDSLVELQEKLEERTNKKLALIFSKGAAALGINIIIFEKAKNIQKFNYTDWYKQNVSQYDGIWIGNGITQQYSIKTIKQTDDMRGEISEEFGYAVEKGKAIKVKLLSSLEK